MAPTGLLEIQKLYGDPAGFIRQDGTVSPLWALRMVRVPFPVPLPIGWLPATAASACSVNQAIADEVTAFFAALQKAQLWTKLVTYDGGYVWRAQRGSAKLSMHAYGAALDFNANTNELGTKGDMDPDVVALAENRGWTWGGRWQRPDPMHFQWVRGY